MSLYRLQGRVRTAAPAATDELIVASFGSVRASVSEVDGWVGWSYHLRDDSRRVEFEHWGTASAMQAVAEIIATQALPIGVVAAPVLVGPELYDQNSIVDAIDMAASDLTVRALPAVRSSIIDRLALVVSVGEETGKAASVAAIGAQYRALVRITENPRLVAASEGVEPLVERSRERLLDGEMPLGLAIIFFGASITPVCTVLAPADGWAYGIWAVGNRIGFSEDEHALAAELLVRLVC